MSKELVIDEVTKQKNLHHLKRYFLGREVKPGYFVFRVFYENENYVYPSLYIFQKGFAECSWWALKKELHELVAKYFGFKIEAAYIMYHSKVSEEYINYFLSGKE
jgi:hypothetical protein